MILISREVIVNKKTHKVVSIKDTHAPFNPNSDFTDFCWTIHKMSPESYLQKIEEKQKLKGGISS